MAKHVIGRVVAQMIILLQKKLICTKNVFRPLPGSLHPFLLQCDLIDIPKTRG